MYSKIYCPVLETRYGGGETIECCGKGKRKRSRPYRESEGFIVLLETEGQHT